MIATVLAVAWAQGLGLGRGGIWNERVEVAVSNKTAAAWKSESVPVDVPALADARPESIRLVDSSGTQLEYAVVSPGRFILPVTAAPGQEVRYHFYAGNPHAWGLADYWPHKPKKNLAAGVRVGELERRNLAADGEGEPWPKTGDWQYRVPVRVCNPSDKPIQRSLGSFPAVEAFHATRNAESLMTFAGRTVPGARIGQMYTFMMDVPARYVRTYYLYVRSGGTHVNAPSANGEAVEGSEIPSDQAYRENQAVDGDFRLHFSQLLKSPENLVRNANFSEGENGWLTTRKDSGITCDLTDDGIFGGKCARLSVSEAGAKGWKGRVQRIPVKPGHRYVYGAFAKGEGMSDKANVHMHMIDKNGNHRFG